MTASVIPLPFKGDLIDYLQLNGKGLDVLWRDRQAYFAVRPICDQLHVAWQPQHRKLTSPESESVVIMMVTTGADGKQYEMLCIAYEDLFPWLLNITVSKVKPQAQEALRRTKAEIRQVLATYYRERLLGEAVSVRRASRQFEDAWAGQRAWRPALLSGVRAGDDFATICGTRSTPRWKIAADIRDAYHLGLIDTLPAGLPAPRVVLTATPANDPRQMPLFREA
ncbi:MAG: hypothetical protein IOC98_12655 [Rhodobacter sp.]|nr:hypothetical protein [Rhodobacter sp.]MCA3500856.1 hypothetical protein [Rhodobacter sp.]